MANRDRFWWEHEYETLEYYDGPLEIAWEDSKGVQRIAHCMDINLYMVGTVDPVKLKRYLDDGYSMRSFYLNHVENLERMRLTRHGVDFEEWDQKEFEDSLPVGHKVFYGYYQEDESST